MDPSYVTDIVIGSITVPSVTALCFMLRESNKRQDKITEAFVTHVTTQTKLLTEQTANTATIAEKLTQHNDSCINMHQKMCNVLDRICKFEAAHFKVCPVEDAVESMQDKPKRRRKIGGVASAQE